MLFVVARFIVPLSYRMATLASEQELCNKKKYLAKRFPVDVGKGGEF
jgi:hypothetical protein